MKLSEFRIAVTEEYGAAYGAVLTGDLVLGEVGGRTAEEALSAGVPARDVWVALCRATDVPASRWHGVGRNLPKA
ncbi:DUF3046 domain-containing protein [Plantibacter sp. YIM 135347]|uniref:DUF3046 domain-containing protein n=1 Tax=Plantibacter sp. YIM 135347 TaxID=3423919 RepID=UPI003D359406